MVWGEGVDVTVWTVGHGERGLDDLVALLLEVPVDLLVDVRRYPGSRRHPQFARESLATALPRAGVEYSWRGEALGGRRKGTGAPSAWRNASFAAYAEHMLTSQFREALAEVEREARSGRRMALMCAETLWWRCHRRLIADALVRDGFAVRHLRDRAPGDMHPASQPMLL